MRFLLLGLLLLAASSSSAQTPGDIAIIGMNADNPDRFAFVALTTLPAGATIHFTDNGWRDDGTFRANEGTYTYTVSAGGLAAGSVIDIEEPSGVAFAASGDQILAYTGDESSPSFLYALNVSGSATWQETATSSNTSALPTGLANGTTAVAVEEFDNVTYSGPTSGTRSELLTAIGNPQNWTGSDTDRQSFLQSFSVSGSGSNLLPAFTSFLEDRQVQVGVPIQFQYDAVDPDGGQISYALVEGPGTIGASTGLYEWTPSAGDAGQTFIVRAQASDGTDAVTTQATLTATTSAPNTPPRFVGFQTGSGGPLGSTFSLFYEAQDAEGDSLTFSLVSGPAGAEVTMQDSVTLKIDFTPTEVGIERFVVSVSDGSADGYDEVVTGVAARPGRNSGGLFPTLSGEALREAIDGAYSPDRTLGYDDGRDTLYALVETISGSLRSNPSLRVVRGIYSGLQAQLDAREDPSTYLFGRDFNAEHIWPQSMGAADEPQRSDMHILYPARAGVNSARSNLPYGDVPASEAQAWYFGNTTTSQAPPVDQQGRWSRLGNGRFEPRDLVKGDVARALFYFWTVYPEAADQAFFDEQLETLLRWNEEDGVSGDDIARSARIQFYQGNVNPFVLDPSLMSRIQASGVAASDPATALVLSLELYPNPAMGAASAALKLPRAGRVSVEVYDMLGRRVMVPHAGFLPSGSHTLGIDASDFARGHYVVRVTTEAGGAATRRLVVID